MAGRTGQGMTALWRASRFSSLRPYDLLVILLAVAILVQLARLIWTAVTPMAPLGDWQAGQPVVMAPAARLALFRSFDGFDRSMGNGGGEAAVTSLDLSLFGIRMNEASGLGSAIIAGSDGVQYSYSVGEEIAPGVTLAEVAFDHVVIDRGGTRESLYLDQSVPAETVAVDAAPAIAPAAGATAPAAPPASLTAETVLASFDLAPRAENGRITGLAISGKGDGQMFAAAGFRAGDVIVEFNGRRVSSAQDIAALRDMLRPGARLSVTVERGTGTTPIAIVLPQP